MIDLIADALRSARPLRIDEVDYSDPSLTLTGDSWSLNLTCPWRVRRAQNLWFSWSSENIQDLVWDLVGYEMESVRANTGNGDPIFGLSDDVELDVFADTDLDPWILHLPTRIFVGSASLPYLAEG